MYAYIALNASGEAVGRQISDCPMQCQVVDRLMLLCYAGMFNNVRFCIKVGLVFVISVFSHVITKHKANFLRSPYVP